jgi:hypothetical protein
MGIDKAKINGVENLANLHQAIKTFSGNLKVTMKKNSVKQKIQKVFCKMLYLVMHP